MSKYEISQIRSMDDEVRFVIYNKEERAFFAGYDFMGSVDWEYSSVPSEACELTAEDDPEQIVKDLKAADELAEIPHLKNYEILVMDDHSNIIHRSYYSCCYKDDAYKYAMDSRKKYNGSEWKVIEIEGSLVEHMNQQAETREQKLQKKLWDCMKKALSDEDKYGCHLREIALHLGRSIESKETYYDTLIDVWCDYFLKEGGEQ